MGGGFLRITCCTINTPGFGGAGRAALPFEYLAHLIRMPLYKRHFHMRPDHPYSLKQLADRTFCLGGKDCSVPASATAQAGLVPAFYCGPPRQGTSAPGPRNTAKHGSLTLELCTKEQPTPLWKRATNSLRKIRRSNTQIDEMNAGTPT